MMSCAKQSPTITLIGNVLSSSSSNHVGDSICVSINIINIFVHEAGMDLSIPSSSDFVIKKDGESIPIILSVNYLLDDEIIASCVKRSENNLNFSRVIEVPSNCCAGLHKISIQCYADDETWFVDTSNILPVEISVGD